MRVNILIAVLVATATSVNAQTKAVGTLFNFVPGLGACGFTNTTAQLVASVSNHTFNTFPGATPNPNINPICHHRLNLTHNGVVVLAPIVDYCISCPSNNVGLSSPGFVKFAPLSAGIVPGVSWVIV